MYTRTWRTTDRRGNVVQVGCLIFNEAHEALTESFVEVGPFDAADEVLAALTAHCTEAAAIMMANDPSKRDPGVPQPPLPFE